MDCPVCRKPLIVVERDAIELDYCLQCQGVWFDIGELELLLAALPVEVSIPKWAEIAAIKSKEQHFRCPRCRHRMDKIELGSTTEPILLDRCRRGHGLWFDAGELAKVVQSQRSASAGAEAVVFDFLGQTLSV